MTTNELPATPGLYISGQVDPDIAEPFVLTAMGRWLWFRGPEITLHELEQLAPMVPLVALTWDERERVHEVADASDRALRLHAAGLEHWGASQASITAVLREAADWRAIAEKTGAR